VLVVVFRHDPGEIIIRLGENVYLAAAAPAFFWLIAGSALWIGSCIYFNDFELNNALQLTYELMLILRGAIRRRGRARFQFHLSPVPEPLQTLRLFASWFALF